MNHRGRPFRAYFSGDATTAGQALTIYLDGGVTAYTLGATEILNVTDVLIAISATAMTQCDVFIGADVTPAAGEYVLKFRRTGANPPLFAEKSWQVPIAVGPGLTPWVLSVGTGTTDAMISGFITNA